MAVYLSPGVFFREVDLSLYVPALSSTAVGMVGVASKGPINEPTFISDAVQFTSIFGDPVVSTDANGVSTPESYAAYAAIQYLTQGRQLWFNRVSATDVDGNYTAHSATTTVYEDATAAYLLGSVRGSATIRTSFTDMSFTFDTDYDVTVPIPLSAGVTSQVFTVAQLAGILNSNSAFSRWAKASVNVDPRPSHAAENGVLKITLNQLGSAHTIALAAGGTANDDVFGSETIVSGVGSTYAPSQLFTVPLTFPYTIPVPVGGPLTMTIAYNIASGVGEKVVLTNPDGVAVGAAGWKVQLSTGATFATRVLGQTLTMGAITATISSLSTDKTVATLGIPSANLTAGTFDFSYACTVTVTLNTVAPSTAKVFATASELAYWFNGLISSPFVPSTSFREHFTATAVGNQLVFVPIAHAGADTDLTPTVTESLPLDLGEELFGTTPAVVTGTTPTAVLTVEALTEGTWGNRISVGFENVNSTTKTFDLVVYYKGNVVERYTKCVRYPSNLGYDAHNVAISNPKYIETITS